MRAAYSVAYLGFWKGGQELSAVGAEEVGAKEVHLPLGVGSGEASFPKSFVKLLNLMNENGVFWCTLEHCFKLNVPATEGLAPDVDALCL